MTDMPINGPALRWARESMFMARGELARAVGTSEARIEAFETGSATPTLRQLRLIGKKLDRTLAFFFTMPPAESDVPSAADFRGYGRDPVPPLLAREMRRAEQYREAVLELEGPIVAPSLVGHIGGRNIEARAREMRGLLGLAHDFLPESKHGKQPFNYWRRLLEDHGFLVFQTTRIDHSVFRGLSIYHDPLPIVLLNGSDASNGKTFTLFHELAHLANRTSGLCALEEGRNEEALANAFAANFLMPEAGVAGLVSDVVQDSWVMAEMVAESFKVSTLAAAIRLKTLGLISDADLDAIRVESDRRWKLSREEQKKAGGGPAAWRLRFRDLGSGYVGTIARALEDERVDWLEASYLLNAKTPMVQQMIDEYHRIENGA